VITYVLVGTPGTASQGRSMRFVLLPLRSRSWAEEGQKGAMLSEEQFMQGARLEAVQWGCPM